MVTKEGAYWKSYKAAKNKITNAQEKVNTIGDPTSKQNLKEAKLQFKNLKNEINEEYSDPDAATLLGNRVKLDAMDRATFGSVRDELWYLGGDPEDADENKYAKDWLSRGRKNNKRGGKIKNKNYSKGGGVRPASY